MCKAPVELCPMLGLGRIWALSAVAVWRSTSTLNGSITHHCGTRSQPYDRGFSYLPVFSGWSLEVNETYLQKNRTWTLVLSVMILYKIGASWSFKGKDLNNNIIIDLLL